MLHRILCFFVIHQESVIDTPTSPPTQASLPSPTQSQPSVCRRVRLSFLNHTANSPRLYFTYGMVNFCVTLCMHLPFSLLSSTVSICPYVYSVCLFLPEKKFFSAISSESIYMCQYTIFIFLFLTYFTLYNRLYFHPHH